MTIESTPQQHDKEKEKYRDLIMDRIAHPLGYTAEIAEYIFPEDVPETDRKRAS